MTSDPSSEPEQEDPYRCQCGADLLESAMVVVALDPEFLDLEGIYCAECILEAFIEKAALRGEPLTVL